MRPACTTSPGSAPTAVTAPATLCDEPRIAEPVLGDIHIRLRGVHLRFRGLAGRHHLVEGGLRDEVVVEQPLLALKLFWASTMRAFAAASSARAACRPLSSFSGLSVATTCPTRTVSPTFTLRSIMRPSMRKPRLTSVSACTLPVRETVSPPGRCWPMTTRTGRISGAAGSSADLQAASISTDSPRRAVTRVDRAKDLNAGRGNTLDS